MRHKVNRFLLVFLAFLGIAGTALAQRPPPPPSPWWLDVTQFGARGNGFADDTLPVRRAIAAAPAGGVVYFPAGFYRVTDEISVNRPISLAGVGRGSQVYQAVNGKNLFTIQNQQGVSVKDLYLGSASTTPGTSLIQLVNTHRSRFDNVTMLGGYYGVYLKGSLLNTFVDLRSGANIAGFFGSTSTNQFWVFAERFNNISANANTFLAPCLEGGANGIWVEDTNGEGSITVYGGTIEGVSGYGLWLQGTGLPSSIVGTHMELNGQGDVYLNQTSRVRIQSVLATTRIEIAGMSLNNTITDTMAEKIVIGPNARRTLVASVSLNLSGTQNPDLEDFSTDTQYFAVTDINPFDWFGTIGVGGRNPNSNPVGLTPDRKVQVNGELFANRLRTPNQIVSELRFQRDGEETVRLSHGDQGLVLEDLRTGESSRLFTQSDLTQLTRTLESQQRMLQALQHQLDEMRAAVADAARAPGTLATLKGR